METVKDIKDFKRFIELNRDKLYARAENANDPAGIANRTFISPSSK